MKLSDIKGGRVLDVLADLVGPVLSIAEDEEAKRLFTRETPPEGVDVQDFATEKIKKGVPTLIKGHKTDMIAILAVLEGVSSEEYANGLTLAKLMADVTELLTDDEFVAFFA